MDVIYKLKPTWFPVFNPFQSFWSSSTQWTWFSWLSNISGIIFTTSNYSILQTGNYIFILPINVIPSVCFSIYSNFSSAFTLIRLTITFLLQQKKCAPHIIISLYHYAYNNSNFLLQNFSNTFSFVAYYDYTTSESGNDWPPL